MYYLFLSELNEIEFSWQVFEKYININFMAIRPNGSRVVPFERTDWHDEANSRFSQSCEKRLKAKNGKHRPTQFRSNVVCRPYKPNWVVTLSSGNCSWKGQPPCSGRIPKTRKYEVHRPRTVSCMCHGMKCVFKDIFKLMQKKKPHYKHLKIVFLLNNSLRRPKKQHHLQTAVMRPKNITPMSRKEQFVLQISYSLM